MCAHTAPPMCTMTTPNLYHENQRTDFSYDVCIARHSRLFPPSSSLHTYTSYLLSSCVSRSLAEVVVVVVLLQQKK